MKSCLTVLVFCGLSTWAQPLPLQPAGDASFASVATPEEGPPAPVPSQATLGKPGKAALVSVASMAALIGTGSALLAWESHSPSTDNDNRIRGTGGTLLVTGILLAPSAGQIWLGDYGHATLASLIRIAGAGAMLASICIMCEEGDNSTLMVLGLGLYAYGLAYSSVQPYKSHPVAAPHSATNGSLQFYPTVSRAPEGKLRPGLAARVTF